MRRAAGTPIRTALVVSFSAWVLAGEMGCGPVQLEDRPPQAKPKESRVGTKRQAVTEEPPWTEPGGSILEQAELKVPPPAGALIIPESDYLAALELTEYGEPSAIVKGQAADLGSLGNSPSSLGAYGWFVWGGGTPISVRGKPVRRRARREARLGNRPGAGDGLLHCGGQLELPHQLVRLTGWVRPQAHTERLWLAVLRPHALVQRHPVTSPSRGSVWRVVDPLPVRGGSHR